MHFHEILQNFWVLLGLFSDGCSRSEHFFTGDLVLVSFGEVGFGRKVVIQFAVSESTLDGVEFFFAGGFNPGGFGFRTVGVIVGILVFVGVETY